MTSGITNTGLNGRARSAVANGYVARTIHVDAGHPAPQTIVAIGIALLLGWGGRNRVSSHVELVPTNCRGSGVIDGLRRINRFYPREILIHERVHQLVA